MPIVHGSALFTRGETQSLCTATVGRRGEQQKVESLLGGEGAKRLFVNYSFPPFAIDDTSVGERVAGGWFGGMAGGRRLCCTACAVSITTPHRTNVNLCCQL